MLNFDLYSCAIRMSSERPELVLTIDNSTREFRFRVPKDTKNDEQELQDWLEKINLSISGSQGYLKKIPAPTLFEFWRQEQLSAEQFMETADTFDVVLFRCNTGGAKLIRTYTNCEFDHVGMCLKFDSEPDELFFLECTSNLGVHLKRFTNLKKHIGTFY